MTDLESDLKAIERGERIDELPLSFEVVETGVERKKDPVQVQRQVANETEEYLEEFDQNAPTDAPPTKIGFFRTLLRWLNTPWSVSWREIKKRKSKNKSD
jgi:hypothetical protein